MNAFKTSKMPSGRLGFNGIDLLGIDNKLINFVLKDRKKKQWQI